MYYTVYMQDAVVQRTQAQLEAEKPEDLANVISTTISPIDENNILASPGLWAYVRPLTASSLLNIISGSGKVSTLNDQVKLIIYTSSTTIYSNKNQHCVSPSVAML